MTEIQQGDTRPRVLLAAGGTGGHIYPAVALAEALGRQAAEVEVQFCCGSRAAEVGLYERLGIEAGRELWVLPVAHNRPGARERLQFVRQMGSAWREARRRLRAQPVAVAVGFGSYVSVAPLAAARLGGARLVLHEQNVHAGLANRLLTPLARWIAVAESAAGDAFPAERTRVVGNPVRGELLRPIERGEARATLGLSAERPVCLCIGGSQGAAGLNRMLLEMVNRLGAQESRASGWQIYWATGPDHHANVIEEVKKLDRGAGGHLIVPYIEPMATAYAAADLVLARAGALTLAEVTALGKPAVLVPLPTAKAGHQALNAHRLAEAGAAVVLQQDDPAAAERLETWLGVWASEPDKLKQMGEAARRLGRPEAADMLAGIVLEVLAERIPVLSARKP